MNKKIGLIAMTSIIAMLGIMAVPNTASAEINQVSVTPINEKVSLETTITTLTVPENNTLPWGTVYGAASDVAERYPVIIQFYKGDEAVHVAQIDTKGDGSYEYKNWFYCIGINYYDARNNGSSKYSICWNKSS